MHAKELRFESAAMPEVGVASAIILDEDLSTVTFSFDREIPIAIMNFVANDSVIKKNAVIKCSQLKGRFVNGELTKIKSFDMKISNGEKMETYKSTNDFLTLPMRNAVRKYIKHGSIIQFTNIRWISKENVNKKLEDLLLFVNDNKTKW